MAVGEELASGGDELIGRFVTEARDVGCSWTEIGERMGVSKQAARQRFVQRAELTAAAGPKPPGRLKPQDRLLACLAAAGREAAADGAAEVGPHHLLAGLFEEGVAAAILEKLGVRVDTVRAAARQLFPCSGSSGEVPPPESAEARNAIHGAEGLARRGGCGYVGTEHLLAALALDPGRGPAGSWSACRSASRRSRKSSSATSAPAGSGAVGAASRRLGRARSAASPAAPGCGWSAGRACTSALRASGCAMRSSLRLQPDHLVTGCSRRVRRQAGEHLLDQQPFGSPVVTQVVEKADNGDDVGPRVVRGTQVTCHRGGSGRMAPGGPGYLTEAARAEQL